MDGFGIDREAISKAMTPKGARALWNSTMRPGADGLVHPQGPGLRLVPAGRGAKATRTYLKPKDAASNAGTQAVNDARAGMRARANRQRTDRIIAGTAGTAAVGSLGVLGYDKATKREPKRVSVAG